MRRERKDIGKQADQHFKRQERDCSQQGTQPHASLSTTAGNLPPVSMGTFSAPSAGHTPPPALQGFLVGPSPCSAQGSSGRQGAGLENQPPLWARVPADWSPRAPFWNSRDRFPGGGLVGCQSRETEKLKNSPTRGSKKSVAGVWIERQRKSQIIAPSSLKRMPQLKVTSKD